MVFETSHGDEKPCRINDNWDRVWGSQAGCLRSLWRHSGLYMSNYEEDTYM